MHRAIAIILSALALFVGVAAERGPISILSDADFNAENGVIGGAGTPADPFLIVGWQIRVPSGNLYGIRIEDTTASFVIRGCSKQRVGEFAAEVRHIRPPEPYLGKGIRYAGEKIRRKAGKTFVGGAAV